MVSRPNLNKISPFLFSINFPDLFSFVRHVVSICNLLCSYVFTMTSVSSSRSSLKHTRFKARLLCSWSNSNNLFNSSLMGLISNLPSRLFRVKFVFTFSSSYLIMSFILRFSTVSTSSCWVSYFIS